MSEAPRVMGGLPLPPLPDYETEESAPALEPKVSRRGIGGGNLLLLIVISVLAGLAGGAVATYSLFETNIAPGLLARNEVDTSLQRMQTQLRDLEGQLEAIRTTQLTLEQRMQEVRQVVATITIQTTNQLTEARNQAARAQQELDSIKIESDLNALNRLFNTEGVPLAIRQANVDDRTVTLEVEYWGFRITDREALAFLSQFAVNLRQTFPKHRMPEDYLVTFVSLQNGRTSTYRHGLWDPRTPLGGN